MPATDNPRPDIVRDKFRGALLGCFVGDALGLPFEGSSRDARLAAALEARLAAHDPLGYSDDTQMMIALAESLLGRGGTLDRRDVLTSLAENFDAGRGYGKGLRLCIDAFRSGTPVERVPFVAWAEGSRGNGAAVRVVALACLYHHGCERLAELAAVSARTTHAHAVAVTGCVDHALAIARALELPHDAHPARPDPAAVARLGNGITADASVPAAHYFYAAASPDFRAVVRSAICHGGDTDTIAAMAGALCGAHAGVGAIPAAWLERLENGTKGRDYVQRLADELFQLWVQRR